MSSVAASGSRAAWAGVAVLVVLVVLAAAVPGLTGWEVRARSDRAGGISVPPLHGTWQPRWFGPGTLPALLLAALGWRYGTDLARLLPWGRLLVTAYVAGAAWLVSLAVTDDGGSGIAHVTGHGYDYGDTARGVTDVAALLGGWVARIDADHPDSFVPVHVAGHPPLALLFFVGLARVGLGSDLAMGFAVIVVAASTAPAVLVTLRRLGAEDAARRAAPFLVLGPAALFMAVSADAVFGAVAAWGLAVLAVAATSRGRGRVVGWSLSAGVLLGCCVLLSYGLPLLGFLALAVLAAARCWWPMPIAAAAALAVVLGFAVAGFAWWEAFPELHDRYWNGLASARPAGYWTWANLAALALCAGPAVGAGVGRLVALRGRADRVVALLVTAAVASVVTATLSQLSRAEVERIWLPFVPWLLVSTALLPESWRRPALGVQVGLAVLMEQLLYTSW
jgi:methylthioxylose transferase